MSLSTLMNVKNKESKVLIMMYRHKTRFAEFIMCVFLI